MTNKYNIFCGLYLVRHREHSTQLAATEAERWNSYKLPLLNIIRDRICLTPLAVPLLPELRSATADLCWKYVSKVLPVRGTYRLVPRIEKHAEDQVVITPAANEQSTKKHKRRTRAERSLISHANNFAFNGVLSREATCARHIRLMVIIIKYFGQSSVNSQPPDICQGLI